MNKWWLLVLGALMLGGVYFGYVSLLEYKTDVKNTDVEDIKPEEPLVEVSEEKPVPSPMVIEETEVVPEEKEIITRDPLVMPFIVQAPNGEWSDERFQNACEEASILMVGSWLKSKKVITDAKKQLLAIMDFEEKKFGQASDTSATDTNTVLREYFGVTESTVVTLKTKADLQALMDNGNVVIVPTDGRKLGNPFFTPPGPEMHMLVILSYDSNTKEYIVNDPGTKRGAKYRYQEQVLFDAVADYTSGKKHIERKSIQKNVIAIPKDQLLTE
jgi:Peptidase_C39 like family